MFGAGCKFRCSERHCDGDSITCDAQSGTCRNGCTPGWKEPSCMKPCDTGRYGADCSFICTRRHCQNKTASCDHVTGSCRGKCEESWIGEDCTAGCRGKYGKHCSYLCSDRKCRNSSAPCDHVTGSCNGKCKDGWNGDTCTAKCIGTYGEDCKHSCGDRHCKDNGQCDHVTGSCNGQCFAGWQGDACNVIKSKESSGSTIVAVAAALGIVSIILVIVSGAFLWYVRRHRTTSGSTVKENTSVANQGGGHFEIVDRQPSQDVVLQRPVGDSESGYVNVGQDIQLNEYEHLDPSESPQNVYDKITGS
ncbi:multiple epidermal growth factor-like domains protein 10 [Gigantopelta aegis]|uniref:multiple epidermal growth factor-like domains protein 10 n=1 Tax=Gigantopelta aegis TaxID=1735272 RepID=UPI001B887AD8|nr:multiple epidermal growth factor-like domains protein 10 [Gigantopelta aegis]